MRMAETVSVYRCSNQACQDEKDKQTALRIKIRNDRKLAEQKRLEEKEQKEQKRKEEENNDK